MIIIIIEGGKVIKAVNTNNIYLKGSMVNLMDSKAGGLEP